MARTSPFDTFRTRSLVFGWLLLTIPALSITLLAFDDPRGRAAEVTGGYVMYGTMALWAVFQMHLNQVNWSSLLGLGRGRIHWRLVLLALPLLAIAIGGIWLVYYPLSFINPELVTSILGLGDQDILPGHWTHNAFVIAMSVVAAPIIEFRRDWWSGPASLLVGAIGLWYIARRYWPEPGWRLPYDHGAPPGR